MDETYLAQAAAVAEDAYSDIVVEAFEGSNEHTANEFIPVIERELVSETVVVSLPQTMSAFAAFSAFATGVELVRQDGPWIVGLDDEMEYITADTLAIYPDAEKANNRLWTDLGSRGLRLDGTKCFTR